MCKVICELQNLGGVIVWYSQSKTQAYQSRADTTRTLIYIVYIYNVYIYIKGIAYIYIGSCVHIYIGSCIYIYIYMYDYIYTHMYKQYII